MRLSRRSGLQSIILKSDCQRIINRLSKNHIFLSDLDNILSNILAYCTNFSSLSWSYVKRDENLVAHHLAKLTPFEFEQIWENDFPPKVTPYILMDNCPLINSSYDVSLKM